MHVEGTLPFFTRLRVYLKERFPVFGNGLLIAVFTFSAIAYSRICRGAAGFIPITDFIIGIFATITLFLLVRIFDEHKDKTEDAQFRAYLPVPRGLITLAELRKVGWTIAIVQIIVITIFQPRMFFLYALVIGYLLLMGKEFFISAWLKRHHLIYITSHMLIIPLVDMYSSGLDWLLGNAQPHWTLAWFFAVSFMNGMVLEFGRKLRAPADEETGVISYTGLYGLRTGTWIWISLLVTTMILAIAAGKYAGFGMHAIIVFPIECMFCMIPAFVFLRKPGKKTAKYIEIASAVWTALMYLSLGAIPMINRLLQT
ncbi:MAG: hypothetical protein R2794_00065 [Chitinophagales bacterium]